MKLGQGGMGAVFLARQKTLRRFCAIKVISPQYAQDKDAADRFLREARATASLSHPNLVGVFDCDQYDNQYFIAMEYVEGMSLADVIRKCGPVPLPLVFHWINQAAIGLDYIHSKNIIHRDIKPDNMILDAIGTLKIMDLGLAKDHIETDQSMTVTGTVMGSPHYMSPEQINDSKTVDHRTDLYSLGISFYQMITGRLPFRQTSAAAICVAHLQEAMPSVNLSDGELTQALDTMIQQMTAKDRESRSSSAADCLALLEPWLMNYPMDESAQAFFSSLGFEDRKLDVLLARENISMAEIDQNLEPAAVPLSQPPPSSPPPSQPPSAFPSQIHSIPPPARRIPLPFKIAAAFTGLLVLLSLLAVARNAGKSRAPLAATKPTSPATAIVVAPPPVPVAEVPIAKPVPAPPKEGTLLVKTKPEEGVKVLLDLQSQSSPATFDCIEPGKHTLRIIRAGYKDQTQEVDILPGKLLELNLSLTRIPGYAILDSQPSGAEVLIKGKSVGKTPYTLTGGEGDLIEYQLHVEGHVDRHGEIQLGENSQPEPEIIKLRPHAVHAQADENNPADPNNPHGHHPPPGAPPNGPPQQPGQQGQNPPPYGEQSQPWERLQMVPMDERKGIWTTMDKWLDDTRTASPATWSGKRLEILKTLEARMKENSKRFGGMPPPTLYITTVKNGVGKILDQARAMPSEKFTKEQKESMIVEMAATVFRRNQMMGGGQGGGPMR